MPELLPRRPLHSQCTRPLHGGESGELGALAVSQSLACACTGAGAGAGVRARRVARTLFTLFTLFTSGKGEGKTKTYGCIASA